MSKKLYVGNISFSSTEDELRDFFAQCGEVASVTIIMDRETGRSKGFGFVEFTQTEDADEALKLNDVTFGGRNLRVSEAKERERNSESERKRDNRSERRPYRDNRR